MSSEAVVAEYIASRLIQKIRKKSDTAGNKQHRNQVDSMIKT